MSMHGTSIRIDPIGLSHCCMHRRPGSVNPTRPVVSLHRLMNKEGSRIELSNHNCFAQSVICLGYDASKQARWMDGVRDCHPHK